MLGYTGPHISEHGQVAMTPEDRQDPTDRGTPESRRRVGALEEPGDAPSGGDEREQIDGAADAGPGTMPEGATPKVPRTSGDPLADAHQGDD
jgi:hypothetical protein